MAVMMEQSRSSKDKEGNVYEVDFDWHVFDTNSKGQIIKYQKLVGAMHDGEYDGIYGSEEVMKRKKGFW